MGYSVSSGVVYGLKVSKSSLMQTKQVRGCNHNIDTTQKFCPKCGKPVFVTQKKMIVGDGYGNKIGYFTSSADSQEEGILGFLLAETDYDGMGYQEIPQPTLEETQDLESFFKDHNLKHNGFKCYVYTSHSY